MGVSLLRTTQSLLTGRTIQHDTILEHLFPSYVLQLFLSQSVLVNMHTKTVVRHTVYNSNSASLSGLYNFGWLFFLSLYLLFFTSFNSNIMIFAQLFFVTLMPQM